MIRNPVKMSPSSSTPSSTPSSPSLSTPEAPTSWRNEGHMRYTKKGTTVPKVTNESIIRKKNEGESCFAVGNIVYTIIDMVSKDFTVPVRITRVKTPEKDSKYDECLSYSGEIVVDKIEDEGQRKTVDDFLKNFDNSFSSIQHDKITESLVTGGKKTKRRMDRSRKNKRRSKSNKRQRKSRR